MKALIYISCEALAVMAPFMLAYFLLKARYGRREAKITRTQACLLFLFAVYIFCVLYVTGSGTVFDVLRCGIGQGVGEVNLKPFSDGNFSRFGYALNAVLFMPLGFLLPLIWPCRSGLRRAVGFGFFFSLLIEASQLLNLRATDVDDLLMNTLGTLAGYLLFLAYDRLTAGRKRQTEAGRYEAAVYVAAMFLGHFLLFDGYGLIKLLYVF